MTKFWDATDDTGINAKCEWSNGVFTVTVSKGSQVRSATFGQTFTPMFGMDIADQARSQHIAEELAEQIESVNE